MLWSVIPLPGQVSVLIKCLFGGQLMCVHCNANITALYFHRTLLTVFLFGIRGFATGFFQAIYLYTPEVQVHVASYVYTYLKIN